MVHCPGIGEFLDGCDRTQSRPTHRDQHQSDQPGDRTESEYNRVAAFRRKPSAIAAQQHRDDRGGHRGTDGTGDSVHGCRDPGLTDVHLANNQGGQCAVGKADVDVDQEAGTDDLPGRGMGQCQQGEPDNADGDANDSGCYGLHNNSIFPRIRFDHGYDKLNRGTK